ncbi:Replicative DNA helicase [Terribacillus aidingensis]|uniref:DNA 5'-3' helicase n=1 Tax=Terribacillus aidingensis TaxID=586416 RepID=A0A285NKJ3_9BACI|nr:DnaB-like helicase C-terminal domain-containing protein [Terribacillus aidingensis]SNZ10020.1 Replicative DNA helicase [Terribacillus aidingensis]
MSLFDKRSAFQVLGNLSQKPSLLDDKQYRLNKDDFNAADESAFYMIIFGAIHNLYNEGLEEVDAIAIDNFLSSYEKQYKVFNENNGAQYIQEAINQSHLRNFEYYYKRLKKFSLLRHYVDQGIDVSDIYDDSIVDPRESEVLMAEFDKKSVADIISDIDRRIFQVTKKFVDSTDSERMHASEGVKELLNKFKETPDYGISLIGNYQNTIFRGGKLKTLSLRSAPSNLGKTRLALGEAADMAIDEMYDWKKKEWLKRGNTENVCFITTENEADELQPTLLAYISGVAETKIKDGDTTEEEDEILQKAVEVLERTNFQIAYIPDFDMQQIETEIKDQILENNIQYIYFDYIHISLQILTELAEASNGMKMREDMVLFMFMNKLDQIRKKYNVFIKTATQVNGEWKNVQNADSTLLRGSKALADKATSGMIALSPTNKDLEAIQPILKNGFYPGAPNVVYHIYKNRHTKFKDMKLWLYVDYDTMRQHELFLTTNNYEMVDISPTNIQAMATAE